VQQVCDRVGIFVEGRLLAVGDIESLSRELFTHGRYLIEVGIDNTAELETKKPNEILTGLLKSINGIESVKLKNGINEIECKHDISGEIAQTLVANGFNLSFLNRREYGLDAIYNRYFEGETNHENQK
jgi:ABC-2 type transport system ATP-binding protein